ncbi:hypothetical protein PCH70_10300 [Pseudomonas cichorii JBC1]|nr:hypothetical protein PCH70_10300 [Pseudomonas cichorii JBC1]
MVMVQDQVGLLIERSGVEKIKSLFILNFTALLSADKNVSA